MYIYTRMHIEAVFCSGEIANISYCVRGCVICVFANSNQCRTNTLPLFGVCVFCYYLLLQTVKQTAKKAFPNLSYAICCSRLEERRFTPLWFKFYLFVTLCMLMCFHNFIVKSVYCFALFQNFGISSGISFHLWGKV